MFLTIFDLILLLLLFIFITFGFVLGLVQAVGALIGVVVGAWVAGHFYAPVAAWLDPIFLGGSAVASIAAFILVFVIVNRLVGIIFWFINKIFNIISIIPFTKSLNRILGTIFGFLEGVLVLGLSLYFISRFSFSEWFDSVLAASKVAAWLIKMASILTPLLPELIRQLKSVI